RLGDLAMDLGGQAHFGQYERQVARDDLEPAQVGSKRLRLFQEDVEADQVLALHLEVLGGGVVAVGGQHAGIGCVHLFDEPRESLLDGPAAMHPDEVGRNLVADRQGDDGGAAGAPFHAGGYGAADGVGGPGSAGGPGGRSRGPNASPHSAGLPAAGGGTPRPGLTRRPAAPCRCGRCSGPPRRSSRSRNALVERWGMPGRRGAWRSCRRSPRALETGALRGSGGCRRVLPAALPGHGWMIWPARAPSPGRTALARRRPAALASPPPPPPPPRPP